MVAWATDQEDCGRPNASLAGGGTCGDGAVVSTRASELARRQTAAVAFTRPVRREPMDDDAHRRGMTVVELLVAVAILVILAGISVPSLSTSLRGSKMKTTQAEMSEIAKSMRAYAEDRGFDFSDSISGRWPSESAGFGSYATILSTELENDIRGIGWNAALRRGWNGPYLTGEAITAHPADDGREATVRSYQVDAWNRYYVYRNRDEAGGKIGTNDTVRVVELISGGADRTLSTEDDLSMTIFRGPID